LQFVKSKSGFPLRCLNFGVVVVKNFLKAQIHIHNIDYGIAGKAHGTAG
jgi:hypothetical protein